MGPSLPNKTQIPPACLQNKVPKAFGLTDRSEERAQRAVERKIPLPSQREAKPDQERNEINGRGPPPAGRMPFMSDSTLIRRSAALRRLTKPQGMARCQKISNMFG